MIRKRQHYISIIMSIVLVLSLFSAVSLDEEKKVEAVGRGKWNSIYFGRYWQNDTNGDGIADQNDEMQAIQWRVLKTTGNYALLLSDKILDAGKFYNGEESTWETSDLRNWLNSTFYKTAFNEKERNAIQIQTLKNYNEEFKNIVLRSNSTKDKVFVPSHTDMTQTEYGFEALYTVATNKRCASNTQYTAAKAGMYASTTCADAYWLRDSSNMLSDVQTVLIQGIINPTAAVYAIQGIRPMIYVDLTDTSLWQQGDLISAGDFSEPGSYNSVQNDSDGNLPTSDDYYPFGKVEPEVTEDPDITTPMPADPEKPQNVYTAQGAWTGWGGADAYPSGKDHEAGDGANNYYNKETTNMLVSQGYNCGLELMNPYNPAFTGADNEMAVFIKKMKSPVIRVTTKNGSAASGWN